MLKTPVRRFSVISNVLNKNESNIKPVFKSHYLNEGAKHFDKNFPKQQKRKPWDDGEQTKDEFYMKKYGSISEKERELRLVTLSHPYFTGNTRYSNYHFSEFIS